MEKIYVLGISKGHDANAALVSNDGIIAASQEERFNRKKHYIGFPENAIEFVIKQANINKDDITYVAIPERRRDNDSLFHIASKLKELGIRRFRKIVNIDHHLAHASSAYRCSGWEEATVVTLDGMGDGLPGTVWHGINGKLKKISEIKVTGSLGWFYSAVTEAIGFRPNDEEGKTMGLAAHGNPIKPLMLKLKKYVPKVRGLTLTRDREWEVTAKPVNGFYKCHFKESMELKKFAQRYGKANLAACTQILLEGVVKKLIKNAIDLTKCGNLAVSGGIFYNVKLNMALENLSCVTEIRPHPAAGDSGLSLGAALEAASMFMRGKILLKLENAYLGPEFSTDDTIRKIKNKKIKYNKVKYTQLFDVVTEYLKKGLAVGWFQGRMEYGPRALGNRSVLLDPRNVEAKDRLNKKLKRREWFMPFAPTILKEHVDKYVYHRKSIDSPFMIKAFKARKPHENDIKAASHVDGTIRVQTITREQNAVYYGLIERFYNVTGIPAILNTSFNKHGLPIVCSPQDAIKHLEMGCIDVLVMNNIVIEKRK